MSGHQGDQPGKRALSTREAFKRIGCGHTKGYELISTGRLRAFKMDQRTIILAEDVEAFLNSLPPRQPSARR